ncbi:MAG: PepSY domain-containing protein [Agarilytica sp.]
MSKKGKFRRKLTKWHRRIGLLSALFVFLLSVTGFFLNHTASLGLDSRFISSDALLYFYSVEDPEIRSFPVDERWISQIDHRIYLDERVLMECEGHLLGVVAFEEFSVVACSEKVVMFTAAFDLIEKIDSTFGLPVPILKLADCEAVCIKNRDATLRLDLDALVWHNENEAQITWLRPEPLPDTLRVQLTQLAKSQVISLEKLMLDLHAGRFMGALGPLFLDLMALCFCAFSATGIYMWSVKRKK